MRIKVENETKNKILKTAKYIRKQFGIETSVEFSGEIHRVTTLLCENPFMGPQEPLLSDAPVLYRSVVVSRLNKMIYWINDDVIEIVDFWDCRREPEKQAGTTISKYHTRKL